MKKLLLLLSLFATLFVVSCGDDEAPTLGLSGTIEFDGTTYTIANGLFSQSSNGGNTEATFFLADGEITASTGGGVSSGNSTIVLSIVALAANSTSLTSGNYATSTNTTELNATLLVTTINGSQTNARSANVGGTIGISGTGRDRDRAR